MTQRTLSFCDALNEAIGQAMEADPAVILLGEGVDDPRAIFGSTRGLHERFGERRVSDLPLSENGMTGVSMGAALMGLRPIMTHQRADFTFYAMDQLVNHVAKRCYASGGTQSVPITIRAIIGRGWGQGPQHSQSPQALFAHIPGLKVVMPATPYDAKGLLIASIEDDNPVIFLEHRWLYNIRGIVPEEIYRVPLGQAKVVRPGHDATIVGTSYMTLEALRASEWLAQRGVSAEVIDVRTLKPLDARTILESVRKTGHVVVADTGWTFGGFGAELVAQIAEKAFDSLKRPPRRLGLADCPVPTTPALSTLCYPRAEDIVSAVQDLLGFPQESLESLRGSSATPGDIPDPGFVGPF